MIGPQEAVQLAYKYLIEMVGVEGPDRKPKEVTLEEIERTPNEPGWYVTFSYTTPGETSTEADQASEPLRRFLEAPRRKLRVVMIDKNGSFVSLKVPN